jgi:hypothetical protein
MVYFQTINPNLGQAWMGLLWKMLVCIFYGNLMYVCTYFKAVLYIFWPFGILGGNLVYFSSFWYVVPKIWQPWNKLLSRKF